MKKAIRLLLAITFTVSLAACNVEQPEESSNLQNSETSVAEESSSSAENVSQEESVPAQQDGGESNILVAYFSWADNAVIDGEVDAVASPSVTSPGNVQQLAGWVQDETGGDLFTIRVTDPYSSDWDECLARASARHSSSVSGILPAFRDGRLIPSGNESR